jgi:TolB-like protein
MDPAAIREQLERVLASETFATAGRLSRLLRYLVERTLAGEGDQLKEYVLGTEVFDRSGSYDPRLDSIVRVEVRRLRSRLEDYYREPGAADRVIITIPRGNYTPIFAERTSKPAAAPFPAALTEHRIISPLALIASALAVATVVIGTTVAFNPNRSPARASSQPGILVLPFEHYSTTEDDARLVAQITDAVTIELARLGTVSVVSRTSAAQYTGGPTSVIELAKQFNVDYVVEASVVFVGEQLRVAARLVDGRLDRKVWVGEYVTDRHEVAAAARQIAAEAASAAAAR